jgi:hypothetical protein
MGKSWKVCASLIAAAMSAGSQSQAQDLVAAARVNVPFAFETSSGQHFRPGVYTVSTTGLGTIVLRSSTSSGMALIQMESNDGRVSQGKAIFAHYGDMYFLRSVDLPGSSTRLMFGKSVDERESLRAETASHPSTVVLALLQLPR